MEYKTTAKLVIQACDKDLPGVFGHGCVLLLQGIAREHSLNRAAKSMGMPEPRLPDQGKKEKGAGALL